MLLTDRQTVGQIDERQTDGQTDRRTDRLVDRPEIIGNCLNAGVQNHNADNFLLFLLLVLSDSVCGFNACNAAQFKHVFTRQRL